MMTPVPVVEPFTTLGWLIRWDADTDEWIGAHASRKIVVGAAEILAELQMAARRQRGNVR